MKIAARLGSLSVVALLILGSLGGVVGTQAGCSGGVCSDDESNECTQKFVACTNAAAASAKKSDCEACVTSYCKCYDDCGSDCNTADHQGNCAQIP